MNDIYHRHMTRGHGNIGRDEPAVERQGPRKIDEVTRTCVNAIEAKLDQSGNRHWVCCKTVECADEPAHDADEREGSALFIPARKNRLYGIKKYLKQSRATVCLPENVA